MRADRNEDCIRGTIAALWALPIHMGILSMLVHTVCACAKLCNSVNLRIRVRINSQGCFVILAPVNHHSECFAMPWSCKH